VLGANCVGRQLHRCVDLYLLLGGCLAAAAAVGGGAGAEGIMVWYFESDQLHSCAALYLGAVATAGQQWLLMPVS
jgi:hypothetical protein